MRANIIKRIRKTGPIETARLSVLLNDIDAAIKGASAEMGAKLARLLLDLYGYEDEFTEKLLDKSTKPAVAIIGTGLAAEQIKAVIYDSPMQLDDGRLTLNQMIGQFAGRAYKDTSTSIRAGIIEGKTTDEIVKEVMRIVDKRTIRQAEAVILTAANHAGALARENVWRQNKKLLEGEEYVATLDSRTTIRCASLDGKVFPFGVGPKPPLHYRCRSFRVPKIKPEYDIPMEEKRQSEFGPVSGKTTYNSWLKRQPADFQNEVLGVERGKLFRSGKYSISSFIDDSGKTYTLQELRNMSF